MDRQEAMKPVVLPKHQRIEQMRPQINYVDSKSVQWIELNRGCKRGCFFCYADPTFLEFSIPDITQRKVQIIGEGFLYDTKIKRKLEILSHLRVGGKVIYYGLSQGIDYRLTDIETIKLLIQARVGMINGKGNWQKGMRIAWDWGEEQEKGIKNIIDNLVVHGYKRKLIQVFVLVNWKITKEVCDYKLNKLKEWGVKIDDCTYNTTKREKKPIFWTKEELIDFRRRSRKHNQLILFNGFDPEAKR